MLSTSLDPSLWSWRSHFQKVMRVKFEFDKYTWEQIDRMEQMMGVYTFGLVLIV